MHAAAQAYNVSILLYILWPPTGCVTHQQVIPHSEKDLACMQCHSHLKRSSDLKEKSSPNPVKFNIFQQQCNSVQECSISSLNYLLISTVRHLQHQLERVHNFTWNPTYRDRFTDSSKSDSDGESPLPWTSLWIKKQPIWTDSDESEQWSGAGGGCHVYIFTVRGGGFSNTQHCVYSLSDVDVMYVPLLRFLGPYIL